MRATFGLRLGVALLFGTGLLGGCTDDATEPSSRQPFLGFTPQPVQCPTSEPSSATVTVTPLGGMVNVGGATVTLPAGAVLEATTITLNVPASNYLEVDITANGAEHFVFEEPITVTIGYGRCARSNILKAPLTAWYWDPATGQLLEQMLSTDLELLETVTFTTPHLSGYVIAN